LGAKLDKKNYICKFLFESLEKDSEVYGKFSGISGEEDF
jgi:hypothetical protein